MPAEPRALVERPCPEERSERDRRRDEGDAERGGGEPARPDQEPLPREPAAALVDDLDELLLLLDVRLGIRLRELLLHDEALADDDRRGREAHEREPEREPEELGLTARPDERVDEDEGDGAAGGGEQEQEHRVLRAARRLAPRDDPLLLGPAEAQPPEPEDERGDRPVLHPTHAVSARRSRRRARRAGPQRSAT